MKKLIILLCIFMSAIVTTYAQNMSERQILQYVIQQRQQGKQESAIVSDLLRRGVTMEQIQQLRQRYDGQIDAANMKETTDRAINDAFNRLRSDKAPLLDAENGTLRIEEFTDSISLTEIPQKGKKIFGHDIFNRQLLTFEPQMNIATPQDYILGPGDQLIIDIYGATQETVALTISPDGEVTVPNYGPVAVSGLTVAGAQSRI
ncbi:MAG: polysaccharide biosynthesis/export family protein, partial [Bacteroidaceae bacterium]|nr:polysaccharide biosynthesis/export family protein [Bacteroidaceae bacterium]